MRPVPTWLDREHWLGRHFRPVTLGALVGVVIVAQKLYSSTSEHLVDFGTVKSLGGDNFTVYAIVAEQALKCWYRYGLSSWHMDWHRFGCR